MDPLLIAAVASAIREAASLLTQYGNGVPGAEDALRQWTASVQGYVAAKAAFEGVGKAG